MAVSRMRSEKYAIKRSFMAESPKFPHPIKKSGSRNTMVTSDFKPVVEIWPFYACAVQNTLYYPYLWRNVRNSRVIWEIGVEEHDGDVRFQTGSILPLFMAECPKFSLHIGNRGRGTR